MLNAIHQVTKNMLGCEFQLLHDQNFLILIAQRLFIIFKLLKLFMPLFLNEESFGSLISFFFDINTKLLAQIEVRDENNKNNWRSSIQQIRSIDDFNIIFVRVPNPFATMKLTSIKISITQDGKKLNCDTKCLSVNVNKIYCDNS